MNEPTGYFAAAHSGGGSSGNSSGGGDESWPRERGEVRLRLSQREEEHKELEQKLDSHREEFTELRTQVLTKLTAIDGKLGLIGFKAGVWASLWSAIAMLCGLLLLYWKIK